MEEIVRMSGIPCCYLRTNLYMENLFWQGEELETNQTIILPLGNARVNFVALQDVTQAAAQM